MSKMGQNIKRIRTEKGLTLRQLAGVAGISHASISRYEKGVSEPPWSAVKGIAEALGVSVSELSSSSMISPGYVASQDSLIKWSNMVSADQSISDYACLITLALPMFADPATWIVSITIESFVSRVKRLDISKVEAHWQEVLESKYIERIGTGEWTLRLKFPDQ